MTPPANTAPKRNTSISICKGIAIILMVLGHTEGPHLLLQFVYLFHMPLFFITAGYFFTRKHLDSPWDFCMKRLKGLYVPFVKWSVFFLLIHNVLFKIGILNETYGNWEGGVTHPYTLKVALQRLTNIVFSMGGYDEFLAGAFWFFRALLVVSIVFIVVVKVLDGRRRWLKPDAVLAVIAASALAFAFLKIQFGLKITTLVQGGIRECWGMAFFAFGVFYRRHEGFFKQHWALTLAYLALLVGGASLGFHGMTLKPRLWDVLTLPLTGVMGFLAFHHISTCISRHPGIVSRFLAYCGDNTLYVFVFHISAFKVVSVLKIMCYGLDWHQIGTHMVVHLNTATDGFFILYTIAGVGIPLLWIHTWRHLSAKIRNHKTLKKAL